MLTILHIAEISDYPYSGVSVVVPQHLDMQAKYAKVGFVNVNNIKIYGIANQFPFVRPFLLAKLPSPFNAPDLVVFQETYRKEYLSIAKELRKHGVPYITMPHGELTTEAQRKKFWKKKLANCLFFNRFVNNAIAIQCLSQRELEQTKFKKHKFIGTNGTTLPEITKVYPDNRDDMGLIFGYIGRLDAFHKGLDLLIEAIGLKADFLRKKACQFRIYGPDGAGRVANLKRLIVEYDVEDLVTILPPVLKQDKVKALMAMDCFVQTSRFEGMPLGILEAMSYALPCLVTDGTTLGKDIEQSGAGWRAENSARSIADALESVVNNKRLLPEKGYLSRKYIEDNFAWEQVVQETLQKYQMLLETSDTRKE